MSKRRKVKKPSYVISDSDDGDEDFVLPVAKRSKSSQDKLPRTRGNVGDRALERDLERAKELSLPTKDTKCSRDLNKENFNKKSVSQRSGNNCCSPDSSGSVNNKKQSKPILISSQSDNEPTSDSHSKPPVVDPLHRRSVAASAKPARQHAVTADTHAPYSDDEFAISPPASSEHSSSEAEFKLSQISSELSDEEATSDEEFKLDSEDEELFPKKSKPKVKPKVKPKQNKAVALPKTATSAAKQIVTANVSHEKYVNSDSSTMAGTKSKRTVQSAGSKPSIRALKPATSARTVNIPAILSSSQSHSSSGSSPLGIKIGLSKNAKFKSLHANIKRG